MKFQRFEFGSIRIDGIAYEHDVVIDRGKVRKRKKKASREFRGAYGHTPLSTAEAIPWDCERLVIGTGANGSLPVMDDVRAEATRRRVDLDVMPTREAIELLKREPRETNAVLHVTC
jgi:hypothetical protein